jgi:hypothetical protein
MGSYGCDSPSSLVQAGIAAAAQASAGFNQTPVVLVSGDFTRHDTSYLPDPTATVENTTSLISDWLGVFPLVVSTWGNDDFAENYFFDVSAGCNQPLLATTAGFFRRNLPNLPAADVKTMNCGGFYRVVLPEVGAWVLSLNTILYSAKHTPVTAEEDPMGQFLWLKGQLQVVRLPSTLSPARAGCQR